jgi:acyl carrier protein
MDAAEIRAIIAKACQLESASWSDETSVYEAGIDSLGLAAVIAYYQEQLSIDLSDNSMMRIMAARTVGHLVKELHSVQAPDSQIPA